MIGHVREELGLHEDTRITKVADRTWRHHKGLVRARLVFSEDPGQARKVAGEAIRAAEAG